MSKDPERILIVRMSHLGDVVCSLPVFHALREAFPSAEIAWVVQPEFAGLLEGLPGLQRVFRFGRRDGWRAWPRLRRELAGFRADLVVDAQANLKSAAAVWCAGPANRVRRAGPHRDDWRERFGARILSDPAPRLPPTRAHAVDRMVALASHVAPGVAPRFDAALTQAELAGGESLLDELLPGAARGDRLLHVAAPGDVRSWPPERFGELAERLAASGRRVLLLSGPREADAGRALEARLSGRDRIRHCVGQRDLRALASLFAAAGRRGMRLVGCDSGPLHLACASGLAAYALAGPQDAARTGPWSPRGPELARAIHAAEPPACAPCLARRCTHADGPVCMTGIGVEAVLEVALAD